LVVQDRDWANFFFPLLDEERQVSLFFGNKKFQDIVFSDPIHYKPLLEIAEHNKLCNDSLLRKIQHVLKKMRGINLDDFGNTVDTGSYITTINNSKVLGGNLNGFFNSNTHNISVTDNNIGTYSIAEIPKAQKAKRKKKTF
jgi:hypothetical protein